VWKRRGRAGVLFLWVKKAFSFQILAMIAKRKNFATPCRAAFGFARHFGH
jgi:hypothetical protein